MTKRKSVQQIIVLGAIVSLLRRIFSNKHRRKEESREPASTPTDLSWESWKKALIETKKAFGDKDLSTLAASIAYGGTLAFFPLIVASVAIGGIALSDKDIQEVVKEMSTFLPSDIASLISTQLNAAIKNQSANIAIAVAGILLALFGVSGAMNNLTNSLNKIYERKETRHIIRIYAQSLGLTALMIVGMIIVLALITLGPDMFEKLGVPHYGIVIFSVLRWILLALLMTFGLSFIYRFAPDRPTAKWQWVSWGAIIATLLWLVLTALFFIYVQNFSNFSSSYSLFAGIIVLMMWLNYSGMVILLGAEVNHQLEKRSSVPATE